MSIDAPAFFFKTTDGGRSWKRKYMNRDPKVFFDGITFWDENNGIAFSDPIDEKFLSSLQKMAVIHGEKIHHYIFQQQ